VELTFNSKTYSNVITKNATIYTNDLANSQTKIYVSCQVDATPDTVISVAWQPANLLFTKNDKSFEVEIRNKGEAVLNLRSTGDHYEDLSTEISQDEISPGSSAKIKFKWNGGFQKENFERSMTFIAAGSAETRFTIPFVVAGTNPTPKPVPPPKKPKPEQNTVNPSPEQKAPPPVPKKTGE